MSPITDKKLKQILIDGNYLDGELEEIDEVIKNEGTSLREYLLANDLITRDILGQALAEEHGIDYYDLNSHPAEKEHVKQIPKEAAKRLNVVVVGGSDGAVQVATSDPMQEGLRSELDELFTDRDVELVFSLENDIRSAFANYQQSLDVRFAEIIDNNEEGAASEILDEIFSSAFVFEASDIHFESREGGQVEVRFRIDGVLQEAGEIPQSYYKNILNRIKVMSNLRIDEHFIAQDGSMEYEGDERTFDVRTSIVPTVSGEKTVLRMLSSYVEGLNLGNLGLTDRNRELLERAAKQPFGMILITGPTGSGKTTTLYSLLRLLDQPRVNITTIEDPVEYNLARANQIQVDKENDLTFAKGLRSIVRQDPDIVLVGEIRDEETSHISVNAALTGHLLLSTFHANDAATAIPRLLDMDVEPFLLSSTLELLVAQRLVRTICESCRHSVEKKVSDLEAEHADVGEYFDDKEVTLYEGKGCDVCNQTGYNGRTGVYEIIEITSEIEELILDNPSTGEVRGLAREQGADSMFADGIDKVKRGLTTLEEIKRVIPSKNV